MHNPRLAARYAKSLLDLAVEQNSLDATLVDMETLLQICNVSKEFTVVMRSPVITADRKNAVIEAVTGNKLQPITKGFVRLLVNKGREGVLPEIAEAFVAQFKKSNHIHTVRIITAAPINDYVLQALKSKIAATVPEGTVEVFTSVNSDLIGGFVLEIGNSIVDASIRRDLNDIRKQFLSNDYISQVG